MTEARVHQRSHRYRCLWLWLLTLAACTGSGTADGKPACATADVLPHDATTSDGVALADDCTSICRGLISMCTFHGRCSGTSDGAGHCLCTATSDSDCGNAAVCFAFGACEAVDGLCGERPAPVQVSGGQGLACHGGPCYFSGRCTAQGGRCVAASDLDCRQSVWCVETGRCTSCLQHGTCAKTSQFDPIDECVVASSKDCLASRRCKEGGSCHVATGLVGLYCVATSDSECAATSDCKTKGECHLWGDRCAATSDADCQASQACKEQKRCKHAAKLGICVAAVE